MAFSNNMTKLLDKIERRLGTAQLNLPDNLKKEKWATIIKDDTLTTFSRYFPNKIRYTVKMTDKKGDYFLIDESVYSGDIEIIGVRDIAWDDNNCVGSGYFNLQSSVYDAFCNPMGLEDLAMTQMMADEISLFNNGIYVDFVPPNKLQLRNCMNMDFRIPFFKVDLLIKHSANLNTIAPTKMETFEELAKADIAVFLYNNLKYYDGLETVFATVDIKISDLQDAASRRDDVINTLKEGYVSASNDNQPCLFSI